MQSVPEGGRKDRGRGRISIVYIRTLTSVLLSCSVFGHGVDLLAGPLYLCLSGQRV